MPGGHQGGVDGLPQGSADSDLVSVPSPLPVTKVSDPVEASSCPLQATDLGDLFKITAVQAGASCPPPDLPWETQEWRPVRGC